MTIQRTPIVKAEEPPAGQCPECGSEDTYTIEWDVPPVLRCCWTPKCKHNPDDQPRGWEG